MQLLDLLLGSINMMGVLIRAVAHRWFVSGQSA